MRVGILYSTEKPVIEKLSESLKKGIETQGAEVRLYPDNAVTFSGMAACRMLFVGIYAPSMFKVKTPPRVKEALHKSGGLVGKRCVAFTTDSGSRGRKSLLAVMSDMEHQGCIVVDMVVLRSEKEAYQFGTQVTLK
jgi:hypothetical protein